MFSNAVDPDPLTYTNAIFKTFHEIEKYIANLKEKFHPLKIQFSQCVESYNRKLKNPNKALPTEIKYYAISYACKHYGIFKSRGTGVRSANYVLASECPFIVRFNYNRHLGGFLMNNDIKEHNHEIGEHIYKHYSSNRDITEHHEEIINMFEAGTKPSLIKEILRAKSGKVIYTKDLFNIRSKFKKTAEKGIEADLNNIQSTFNKKTEKGIEELINVGEKFLKENDGNEFVLVLDEKEAYLEMVYIQSDFQKKMYEAFGEMLQIDATYHCSNIGTPFFDFVVIDGNGKSVPIAYCFVSSEAAHSVLTMLEIFQDCNPTWDKTKVILIDKDFSEVSVISEKFQNTKICLCTFHMMCSITTKVNNLKLSRSVKQNILCICKKIVNTTIMEEFEEIVSNLKELSNVFYAYFVENWINCKEKWSPVFKEDLLTLLNAKTNGVECHHQFLKKHLSTSKSLNEAVGVVLTIVNTSKTYKEIINEEFQQEFCTVISANCNNVIKDYFKICTAFAAELIAAEYVFSLKYKYTVVVDKNKTSVITAFHVHNINEDASNCSCEFNIRMSLPCRHLFLVRKLSKQPIFDEKLVGNRFRKGYAAGILEHGCHTTSEYLQTKAITVKKSKCQKSKEQKYKDAMEILQKIANVTCELNEHDYHQTINMLGEILKSIQNREVLYLQTGKAEATMVNEQTSEQKVIEISDNISENATIQKNDSDEQHMDAIIQPFITSQLLPEPFQNHQELQISPFVDHSSDHFYNKRPLEEASENIRKIFVESQQPSSSPSILKDIKIRDIKSKGHPSRQHKIFALKKIQKKKSTSGSISFVKI